MDRAGADLQDPALGHRLAGVLDEVVDDLAHLPFVEIDGREVLRDVELAGDVRPGGRELSGLAQHPGDVADAFDRLAALGERDELPGQVPGAQRGLGGMVERLGGVRARPGEEAREVEVAEDDRQQVVEVVREAAGEHSHGFELLGAHVLVLESLLVGEIPGQDDHRRRLAPGLAHQRRGEPELDRLAAVIDAGNLPGPAAAAAATPAGPRCRTRRGRGGSGGCSRPTPPGAVHPRLLHRGAVAVDDPTVEIGDEDPLGRALDGGGEEAEPLLAFLRAR